MILGLVSNCWRQQLKSGTSLESLIDEAAQRGFGAIELRQACVGEFETGSDCIPDAEALPRLPARFGDMQFNVAMALPYLSPTTGPDSTMFQAGLRAAVAVSGQFTPQLRLVDLTTKIENVGPAEIDAAVTALASLVDSAADAGVLLSVENSIQPWSQFREILGRVSTERADEHAIRLCYDAANLYLQADRVNPAEVTRSLRADDLSMVHFKQRAHGRFLDAVCDGDIHWRAQFDALAELGFSGPALFEIESSADIWQSIDHSRQYLETQGGRFDP
ncbi:MAG: sugar phosphate isomerase/epimerase [Planctomycetaceae bacterium]